MYDKGETSPTEHFNRLAEAFVKNIIDHAKTNLVLCCHTTDCFYKECLEKGDAFEKGKVPTLRRPDGTVANKDYRMESGPRVERVLPLVLNKEFTWGPIYIDERNGSTPQDNYGMFEEVEKDTGKAAHQGINQVITEAGPRLGTKDFSIIGTYFTEMGILGEGIKMMVTPATKDGISSSLHGTDKVNGISLEMATLLPTHKTGVLFEKGLTKHTSTNNTEASKSAPYMLSASAFGPNGPYIEGQPATVTVPAGEKRTTESQLHLWGCKTFDTMKSELGITDDDEVPPLLRKGDVLVIEGVQSVQLQWKNLMTYCDATFTVREDVAFPKAAATTPTGITSDPAGAVAVNISPSINPGKVKPNAKVRVLSGLESLKEYKVEYACPKSAIALSARPIRPIKDMYGSIVKANLSPRQVFWMSVRCKANIMDLTEKWRFDSIYGVEVISPEHCIKHFVKSE